MTSGAVIVPRSKAWEGIKMVKADKTAEDVVRDWWYSASREQALTSKEGAIGLALALSQAGFIITRDRAGLGRPDADIKLECVRLARGLEDAKLLYAWVAGIEEPKAENAKGRFANAIATRDFPG